MENKDNKFNIYTTLTLTPAVDSFCDAFIKITRGATSELIFDFDKYAYLAAEPWDTYIEQMTFLLKWNKRPPIYYKLKHKDGTTDSHFAYDEESRSVSLLLTSAETGSFGLAGPEDPVQFEVAVEVDTEKLLPQKVDSVIIEEQTPIIVQDSLYNQAGLATDPEEETYKHVN